MIHYNPVLNIYQFDLPHHNVNNRSKKKVFYNQLFIGDKLYVLDTIKGIIYTNSIDLDKVDFLKQYNFHPDNDGKFCTNKDGQMVYIHELVYQPNNNQILIINHIDGDPINNKLSNLEVVTNWCDTAVRKTIPSIPVRVRHHGNNAQKLDKIISSFS